MLAEEALPAVFGPYLLTKALGKGGMGTVYLAKPINPIPNIPDQLVVKLLHAHLAKDDVIRRFRHEVEVAARIRSPHVAQVYALGQFGPTVYLAMEYIDGVPLSVLIEKWRERGSLPALGTAVGIVRDAVRGIVALHDATDANGRKIGFVHRDIAPKNIMVGSDGVVRVIDLGIGRSELKGWETVAGAVMGTPGFMAPEQVDGKADVRSDIFSLGAVLFETLTLRPLVPPGPVFEMLLSSAKAETILPSAYRNDVPSDLDALIIGAVRAAPEHRYPDSADFLARLDVALNRLGRTADLGLVVSDALGAFVSDAATLIAPGREEDYLFPPSASTSPSSSKPDVSTEPDLAGLSGDEPTLQRDRSPEIDSEIAEFRLSRRPVIESVNVDSIRPERVASAEAAPPLPLAPPARPLGAGPAIAARELAAAPPAKSYRDLIVLGSLLVIVLAVLAVVRSSGPRVESLGASTPSTASTTSTVTP
ncbi:MAG: serine/threonine protein kinase [Deltaproteobacteria bacterium]|nr:serine/threonine protein kinase [Deltaproteobacteria bacterium]